MTALTTEHFALQGARGRLTSEGAGRASLYLGSVTGSLIAMGFVANNGAVFLPFAAAIIPALILLGEFTYWRLVMSGVEDLHYRFETENIRAYYRRLVPEGLNFFADATLPKASSPSREFLGVRVRDLNGLLTAASMAAVINSIVVGAGAALVASTAAKAAPGAAIGIGAVMPSLSS